MRIAIDVSPLESGHKFRGVGFYLKHLKDALVKYFPEHEYIFFKQGDILATDIDIVHYPYFEPFSVTLPFYSKHKVVVTVHDLTPIVFPKHFPAGIKGSVRWQIQRRLLGRVSGIVTDSNASKKDIINYVGIDEAKIKVAYLAAGEQFIRISSQQARIKEIVKKFELPEKFVFYVGDVTWNKNVPRLVEATVEAKVPLLMAGKTLVSENYDKTNAWNRDLMRVQEMVKKNKNVRLLGFVSDEELVTLYNCATVFVFPSLYEGFGMPVLEAMACGCPVITTRESSLPEVAGKAALYADGYDKDSIAQQISRVMASKTLRSELVSKGFSQAKKFSWKKTAQDTIEVYKRILS